jgi:ABC-type glycerol-3-phosphate transport system permease component
MDLSDKTISSLDPTLSSRTRSTFQPAPYLFSFPTIALMALFTLFPMLYGVWMSLQKADVIHGTSRFVGLANYIDLFHDPQFGLSVLNTAWYTLTVVPLIVADPRGFSLVNFKAVFGTGDVPRYAMNLSLANLIGTNTVEWGTLLAYATLAMVPVLIVFLCFQRYFLKGSLSGGVKG